MNALDVLYDDIVIQILDVKIVYIVSKALWRISTYILLFNNLRLLLEFTRKKIIIQ